MQKHALFFLLRLLFGTIFRAYRCKTFWKYYIPFIEYSIGISPSKQTYQVLYQISYVTNIPRLFLSNTIQKYIRRTQRHSELISPISSGSDMWRTSMPQWRRRKLVMWKYPLVDKRPLLSANRTESRTSSEYERFIFVENANERDISMYTFPFKHLLQLPSRFISSLRFGAKTARSLAWSVCFCLGYYC